MKRYKMTLSYFGKDFSGWQIQPDSLSVQQMLQEKLTLLLKEEIKAVGAGRTDSSVHALEQTAHFDTSKEINTDQIKCSLNALLSPSIRILSLEETDNSFHARYSARGKTYRYLICNKEKYFPFLQNLCYLTHKKIDLEKLKKAALIFLGTHNFLSFSNKASVGCAKNKPTKTIYSFEIIKKDPFYIIEITGDGFLYKMVRNIVGALLSVNDNKLTICDIRNILMQKDRTKAPAPAEAFGLYLVKVHYLEEEVLKKKNDKSSLENLFPSFSRLSKQAEQVCCKEP